MSDIIHLIQYKTAVQDLGFLELQRRKSEIKIIQVYIYSDTLYIYVPTIEMNNTNNKSNTREVTR